MANGIPTPRIPAADEVLAPVVNVEESLIGLVRSPFRNLGLPELPRIEGPVSIVNRVVRQLPRPPQIPELRLPGMDRR